LLSQQSRVATLGARGGPGALRHAATGLGLARGPRGRPRVCGHKAFAKSIGAS